jgi:hypothetical protein
LVQGDELVRADEAKDSAKKAAREESRARTAGTAADEALKTAMTNADDAEEVEKRIETAEVEVAQLASHAGLAARVASDAAAGAAQGEKIAMQASYEARSRLRDVYAAVPPAWGAAPVAGAAWGVPTAQPAWGAAPLTQSTWPAAGAVVRAPLGSGSIYPASPLGPLVAPRPRAYAYGASAEASLRRAKELVDTVIVLMQELTRSLEGALEAGVGRCRQVRELLAWYQAQMSQYHVRGLQIAHLLSEDDMELVEEYAQAQVSSFSAELEAVVSDAADECSVSTTAFLPDVPAAALPPAAPLGVYAPPMVGFSGLSQRRAAGRESLVARAKVRAAGPHVHDASSCVGVMCRCAPPPTHDASTCVGALCLHVPPHIRRRVHVLSGDAQMQTARCRCEVRRCDAGAPAPVVRTRPAPDAAGPSSRNPHAPPGAGSRAAVASAACDS